MENATNTTTEWSMEDEGGSFGNLFETNHYIENQSSSQHNPNEETEVNLEEKIGDQAKHQDGSGEVKKPADEERTCTVCGGKFIYREFNKHKTTLEHKRAKREKKRLRHQTPMAFSSASADSGVQIIPSGHVKEKYFFREPTDLPQQVEQYQKILTAFLSLRYCLNNENKDVKISMNNNTWSLFGDIVIEILSQENQIEIEAIQCKKIQSRNDMSLASVIEDKGKLSLTRQLDDLMLLRNKGNYQNTLFKLFTLSKLKVDTNMTIICDEEMIRNWQSETKKQTWMNRKVVVAQYKKNNPINTTDDPDNICIFKILDPDGRILEDLEKDLCKFSLFMNQRKSLSLKHLIRMIIEDKFGATRDITEEIVKFFCGYFNLKSVLKYHFKLRKRDVLLKIAELLLTPYMLLPETTSENGVAMLWNDVLKRFDVVVIKNQSDTINKIYTSINTILQAEVRNIDNIVMKTFILTKESIRNNNLKSEIFFDSPEETSRKVSLSYLYFALWKVELAPLVLMVENEENLSLIIKVINFLHTENLPLKFILATNKNIHTDYLPEQLKTFTNLKDLQKIDKEFLENILKDVTIPFLNFSVKIEDIVKCNPDFLSKVTPNALLNISFQDYSFKNVVVPLTDDIIDNTLVLDDNIFSNVRSYFWDEDNIPEMKNLSYFVNVDGYPTYIEVPPDI